MSSDDLKYFRARAAEERERASTAASAAIRSVHLELAVRYDQLAGKLHTTTQMQSSLEAVQRSLQLLRVTTPQQ